MAAKQIIDGAYLVPMGNANSILLDVGPELVLIDAGFPNKEAAVLEAIGSIGRQVEDLKHIVFTHGHPDHIGSAAALIRISGAKTYMHAIDAPFAESGGPFRPMTPARGIIQKLVYRLVWDADERMEPFAIDHHVADGEMLPLAGGLRAVLAPGHCAGQLAFLWQGDRLLIAGDVFTNILGVGDPIGFEDEAEGHRSMRRLATLDFKAACFGHGKAISSGAKEKVRRAVGKLPN